MEELIIETEKFVTNLLSEKLESSFLYHNLTHTKRVFEKAKELAELSGLNDSDKYILTLATLLHDTGFTVNIENHEEESIKISKAFLSSQQCDRDDIDAVCELIRATKIEYIPKKQLEKIIRDADCSHVGSKSYFEVSELLRKEWEIQNYKTFTEIEWLNENINFLSTKHRFYTPEAAVKWDKRKGKNLSELLKSRKKLNSENKKIKQKKEELTFKKNKIELPERGIETMFRVTLKNHMHLSNIADTKANILLSVNAIIVSLVLSNLVSKLDNTSNKYLIVPTVIFVLFTVLSIILSVLATRPNITTGKFTKEDVSNKKVNLLFFGNFHKMSLNDFEWALGEMMNDKDYLYSSMKKDLYFLGLVLNKKYKILRITYLVFMTGIIISVFAFAIAFRFFGGVS